MYSSSFSLLSTFFFFFKQQTAYEIRISDLSSDVCSSDLGCRQPDRDDDGGRYLRLAAGARLHHRLHGRRSRLPALLQLHQPVHVLDADAGDVQQLPAAVLRLGSGGAGVVPADRLLVQAKSEEHTSELQSLMRISYAVFCLKTK